MLLQRMIPRKDMIPCALCDDPPCTKACGRMDCGRLLRAVWFDNEQGVPLPKESPCVNCAAPCESACIFPKRVPIWELMTGLAEGRRDEGTGSNTPFSRMLSTSLVIFSSCRT